MSTHSFPGRDAGSFEDGRLKWDILNTTAAHRRILPGSIDLTDCEFLRPYAIACLCSLGVLTRGRIELTPPRFEPCRQHLGRMGLYQWFKLTTPVESNLPRDTNLVVEHLTDRPGNSAGKLIDLLLSESPAPAGVKRDLADHLDEIIRNALCHAGSPMGCMVAGQAFPKRQIVELAILDLGCTIPGHLRRNPKHRGILSDAEAVIKATEDGVTGTVGLNSWGEANSGAGLYELRHYCESGNGEMSIVTGPVIVSFSTNKGSRTRRFRGDFSGCLVNIRFFLNQRLHSPERSTTIW